MLALLTDAYKTCIIANVREPHLHIRTGEEHAPPIILLSGSALRDRTRGELERIRDTLRIVAANLLQDTDVDAALGHDITPDPAGYTQPGLGLHRMSDLSGKTQADMAEATGYSRHGVAAIEADRRYPAAAYVVKAAAVSGHEPKTIFIKHDSDVDKHECGETSDDVGTP